MGKKKNKKGEHQQAGVITEIKRYVDGNFILPAVIEMHDFEGHAWIDVIQLKGEQFSNNSILIYNGGHLQVQKKIKDSPIQTDMPLEDRLSIRRVRYFCNKII